MNLYLVERTDRVGVCDDWYGYIIAASSEEKAKNHDPGYHRAIPKEYLEVTIIGTALAGTLEGTVIFVGDN